MALTDDQRWLSSAIALSERARGLSAPNPNVGCVIVNQGRVVGRGWTGVGGRPHAEAIALTQAGEAARGGTLYTTLEPCAHHSTRGPTCSHLIAESGVERVVVAAHDPDPRTDGKGMGILDQAGIEVVLGVEEAEAESAMAPFLTRTHFGRPFVTLKLAVSADGRIARPAGENRWITGPVARAHGHMERVRHDAILVGRGTFEADQPRLDVRLPGLEDRSPMRLLLTRGGAPEGWHAVARPSDIAALPIQSLLVEGGGGAAKAFLDAGLVDRILLYRAPTTIGAGENVLDMLDLDPPGQGWAHIDSRMLGIDRLDVYESCRVQP